MPNCPLDVVIPTRDRPRKLARCLMALAAARAKVPFRVYVCDSSTSPALRQETAEACGRFDFVELHCHQRAGLPAARNELTRVGRSPLLVSVDDDVYVQPEAVERLLACYRTGTGWRVVAGSVAWGPRWSGPVVMRPIGYGRLGDANGPVDFLLTALLLYPRELAKQFPFNERIRSSDDRFVGALWRAKGVALLFEPSARANHDDEHTTGLFTADHQDSHIYTNLFDALLVRRKLRWALAFDFLGFLAGAKTYFRSLGTARAYIRAWALGHAKLVRDWRALRREIALPLIGHPPEA